MGSGATADGHAGGCWSPTSRERGFRSQNYCPVCALSPHSVSGTIGDQICLEDDGGSHAHDRNALYPPSCGGDDDDGGGDGLLLDPVLVLSL